MVTLEQIIYYTGFATSIAEARQLINHKKIFYRSCKKDNLNNVHVANIPSMILKPYDVIFIGYNPMAILGTAQANADDFSGSLRHAVSCNKVPTNIASNTPMETTRKPRGRIAAKKLSPTVFETFPSKLTNYDVDYTINAIWIH